MKILIFESQYGGHRTEFIQHIIDYYDNQKNNLVFCVNSKIQNELKNSSNILFIKNEFENLDYSSKLQIVKNSKKFHDYFNLLIKTYNIQRLVFMNIDMFQLIIGRIKFELPVEISGILFEPYPQYPRNSFLLRLKRYRKKNQLKWLLRNPNIKSIFILNDKKTVDIINKDLKTSTFKFLVDPITCNSFNQVDIHKKYQLPINSKYILFIGGLQSRKNILNLIKSFNLINFNEINKFYFLILGKINDCKLKREIKNEIFNSKNRNLIVLDESYIEPDIFESAILQSEYLTITYKDFYCSSGIIGHAAKHNKKVLSSNYGLIKEITDSLELGICVDPDNLMEISSSMLKLFFYDINKFKVKQWTENNSPHKFVSQIFK